MQNCCYPLCHRASQKCWHRISHHRHFTLRRAAIDQLLKANERRFILSDDHQQSVLRVDVAQVAANRPIEDFYSASKCLSSNAFLFGIFDGHGGAACARHVCTRLFDYICCSGLDKHRVVQIPVGEQIHWLGANAPHSLPQEKDDAHLRNVREYHRKFRSGVSPATTVRSSLQAAFLALDDDLSKGAMPDQSGRICRMSVNVAASGSCALVVHVRKNNLHVANVGDSSAVLGVCLPNGLIARQLTRPHTSENVDEIHRIRSAHPATENRTILRGDRLLGELYPLRAFGDVRYKWPLELQKVVLEPLGMPAPSNLLSPPYLTALPEVFYHQLTNNDSFLILASDGLWEFLDPDTAVRLVHDHALGTQTLSDFRPDSQQSLGEILGSLETRKQGYARKPLDENSATHLIRSALGGCSGGTELQYARLEESLMLPPGMARNYRDDITIMVVHFKTP
ncbi:hypothetical protein niasHT_015826 [Heterodera trifolii]|uniref:PPM-type phosphatase domain-containing protein n=1 Tax=Heterodera trifolii TaxID=157864 RepID=A0ABD2L506_9BILA